VVNDIFKIQDPQEQAYHCRSDNAVPTDLLRDKEVLTFLAGRAIFEHSSALYICGYAQVGDSLEEFLVEATPDPKLRQILMSLSEAVRTIAFKVSNITLIQSFCLGLPCCWLIDSNSYSNHPVLS
jgi:hypothetical protein